MADVPKEIIFDKLIFDEKDFIIDVEDFGIFYIIQILHEV